VRKGCHTRYEPFFRLDLPIPNPPPLFPSLRVDIEPSISEEVEVRPGQEEDEADRDGEEGKADMFLGDSVGGENHGPGCEAPIEHDIHDLRMGLLVGSGCGGRWTDW